MTSLFSRGGYLNLRPCLHNQGGQSFITRLLGVGEPAGRKKAAKRRTAAIRRERLRTQARQGAAINKTVGPTLKKTLRS